MSIDREAPVRRQDNALDAAARESERGEPSAGVPGKHTLTDPLSARVFRRAAAGTVSRLAARYLARASSTSGRPLPDALRRRLERALGARLDGVRIHVGDEAATAARAVAAQAYTIGKDIYFAAGVYAPETQAGQRLLAHEVAHTLQTGPGGTTAEPVAVSQPGDAAEVEADAFADRFADTFSRAPAAPPAGHAAPVAPKRPQAPAKPGVIHASQDPAVNPEHQRLEAKYGRKPKSYGGLFNNSNRAETLFAGALPEVVAFINERFKANGYPNLKVSAPELANNFITEGGFYALDEDNADEIEGYGELGLDSLIGRLRSLRPWLHESVLAMASDKREHHRAENERGEVVTTIGYMDIVTGLYASAGMYAEAKARASKAVPGMARMPEEGAAYWSTVYFNSATPGKTLQKHGPLAYQKPYRGPDNEKDPRYNAAWRTASFEYMRDNVNFDLPDHGAFPRVPWGVQKGDIALDIEVASLNEKQLTVEVEYSADGGKTFTKCTGEPISGSSGGREGTSHEFKWDSEADLPGKNGVVTLRVTSSDGSRAGRAQTFPIFIGNGELDLKLSLLAAPTAAAPAMKLGYPVELQPTLLKLPMAEHPLAPFLGTPGEVTIPLDAVGLALMPGKTAEVILRNDPTGVDSEPLEVPLSGTDAVAAADAGATRGFARAMA